MPRIAVAPTLSMPEDLRLGRPNDYVESLRAAGVEVVVLDPARDRPEDLLADVDGVMLLGGHDVDPGFYGEARHATFDAAPPGRDEFEIGLARLAIERARPLLAICRGLQVLNVALGGSLVQDIPSEVAGPIDHAVNTPKDHLAHAVDLVAGSRLEQALGTAAADGRCRVNSRHHQSVKTLGRNLLATALAADGVVEGAEHSALPFCVGVQWHPENFWPSGRFQPLFAAFAAHARNARRSA